MKSHTHRLNPVAACTHQNNPPAKPPTSSGLKHTEQTDYQALWLFLFLNIHLVKLAGTSDYSNRSQSKTTVFLGHPLNGLTGWTPVAPDGVASKRRPLCFEVTIVSESF